jgi:hypothetical protein
MVDKKKPYDPKDSNPDPLTGEPGAHPVGTGIGAAVSYTHLTLPTKA